MESEEIKKNCGTTETPEIELPNKICQVNCRICSSDYLIEIHLLKKNGLTYEAIVEEIKKKSNGRFIPSESSLCRHFQKYNEIKSVVAAGIMKKDLVDESMKRAAHSSAVVELIDKYIELLRERTDAGLLKVNISDMEKLFNIKYKLLEGGSDEDKDLLAVFQRSVDRFGLETSQGVLFGRPSSVVQRTANVENSQNRKEAERVGAES